MTTTRDPGFYWVFAYDDDEVEGRNEIVEVCPNGEIMTLSDRKLLIEEWGPKIESPPKFPINWNNAHLAPPTVAGSYCGRRGDSDDNFLVTWDGFQWRDIYGNLMNFGQRGSRDVWTTVPQN